MARYIALIFSVIFCVISVNSLVSGVKNKDPSLEIIKLEDAEEGYDYRPKDETKETAKPDNTDDLPIYPLEHKEEVSDKEAVGTKAVDTENEPSAVEEPYAVEQPSQQETYPDAYNLEENNGYDTAMKNTEPEEDLTGTFYENNGEINEVNDVHLNIHGRESGTNEEVNAKGGQENFEESTNQIDFPGNNYIESDDNREKQVTEQNSVDTENQDTNQQLVKEKTQIEVPENEIQEPSENGQSKQKQQNPLEPEEVTEQELPVETEPANVEGSESTKIEHEEEPEEETGDVSEHEANTGSELIEHVEAEEYQEIGENDHADNLEVQKNEVHPDMEYVTENSNYREPEKEEHENVEHENEERVNKENEIEEKEDDNKENEQNERFAKNEYETEASEFKKSDSEEPFVDEENEDNKEGEEKKQETNMVFSEVNPLRPSNIKQSSRIYSAIQDSLAEEEKEKEETEIDHKDPDIEPPGYLRDIQSFPFRASKEEIKTDEDEVCSLTAKTGFCKAYFRRYYFNSMTGECENFVYGGCGGNGNNFETLTDCRKTCMKHVLL